MIPDQTKQKIEESSSPAQPRPSQEEITAARQALGYHVAPRPDDQLVLNVALALSRAKQENDDKWLEITAKMGEEVEKDYAKGKQEGREAALDEAIGVVRRTFGNKWTKEEMAKLSEMDQQSARMSNVLYDEVIAALNALKGKGLNAKE